VNLVIDVCRTISYINSGDQASLNVVLSRIVAHPIFEITPMSLWEIAKENLRKPDWFESIQRGEEFSEFAEWMLDVSRNTMNKPLGMVIEDILGIGESSPRSYVNDYMNKAGDSVTINYIQTLAAVQQLRKLVAEFTPQNEPTINNLIDYIDTKLSAGQPIPNPYSFESGVNSVNLLTVHKAKGLEFDAVYVIDVTDDNWSPSRSTTRPPINLPLASPLESHNDYARLMYVAASRAKQNLVFTSYSTSVDGESVLPTPLIEHVDRSIITQSHDKLAEALKDSLKWPRLAAKSEKQVLSGILENFTINVTNLINFLDVTTGGPDIFLSKNLLRLPEVKNASMMHGTAMHSALEFAQIMTNKTGKTPSTSEIKQAYGRALSKEYLTVSDRNKYIEHGHAAIDKLINKHDYKFIVGSRPEFTISDTFIGEARVGGKLDRIDFLPGNKMRIVDYKTGNGLTSFETRDKNKQIKAWKHKLQLVFYALLAQHHPELSRHPDLEGQMVYVESDTSKYLTLSHTPTDVEIERLARIVESVWKHVQDYDLPDTSGFSKDIDGILAFEESLIN
jgi:ATP-dependent exoDNAse (exonuclease V) beta subunit